MREEQTVSEMVEEVLARQARARAERTGETFEEALKAVSETEAGRQLQELRDGPHHDEGVERWQEDLLRARAKERSRDRLEKRGPAREERSRVRDAVWKAFMREERLELELRKAGQLAGLLGEALPGEPAAELRRLASEDQRQAEEELVALVMHNGKVFYKHLEELCVEDMSARAATNRLRMRWLKERQDSWLGRGKGHS